MGQGVRHTISEAMRCGLLERLLALNHQRYAGEVAAELHDKKGSKKTGSQANDTEIRKRKTHQRQLELY